MTRDDIQRAAERLSEPELAQRADAILGATPADPGERLALLSAIAIEPREALMARAAPGEAMLRKVEALETLAYAHGLIR